MPVDFILFYFIISNILLGCYNWYQSKSFENILKKYFGAFGE